MITRPWPIKILFICHILAPLVNAALSARMSNASIGEFLIYKFSHAGLWELLSMFVLVPLGGLVIFACKRWSYYTYLLIMAVVFYFNYQQWQKFPHLFSIYFLIGYVIINVFIVGYFLIPSVRLVYFNKRLRWWESKPRYMVGLIGEVLTGSEPLVCEIVNISQDGARLSVGQDLNEQTPITLRFTYENDQFEIDAIIRNAGKGEYGVEFNHTPESKKRVKNLIRKGFAKHFAERTPTPPMIESFFTWLHTLLSTGKGIVPDIPKPPKKRAPKSPQP